MLQYQLLWLVDPYFDVPKNIITADYIIYQMYISLNQDIIIIIRHYVEP